MNTKPKPKKLPSPPPKLPLPRPKLPLPPPKLPLPRPKLPSPSPKLPSPSPKLPLPSPKLPLPPLKVNSTVKGCTNSVPYVNSEGLWAKHNDPKWWLNNSLPLLQFHFLLIFISIVLVHFFLKRMGVPKIASQIIAGLLFGCAWKHWTGGNYKLFRADSEEVLALLAYFGYAMYLFLAAVKIDVITTLKKGKKALTIGIPSLFGPLISGLFVEGLFQDKISHATRNPPLVFVSVHSLTSLPVTASVLSELKIINSDLGRLGISSALVSDLLSMFVVIASDMAQGYRKDPSGTSVELGAVFLLFLFIIFAFRPAILWIINQTPEGKPVQRCYIQGVVFLVLLSIVLSNLMGPLAIFGPYIMGLAVPDGAPMGSTLVDKFECLVLEVLLPILVTTCAFRADLSLMLASFKTEFTKMNIILLLVVSVIKIISCFLSSIYCKLPFKESMALSLIMSSKGVVQVVLYTIPRDYGVISDDGLLAFLLLSVAVAAIIVPQAVRYLYDSSKNYAGYQNRNIIHLNSNSELRVLTCIHRNQNINGIVHLLNLSCPTAEKPIAVYVFHLIELIGRTTPVFIAHRLQNNNPEDEHYSENIILTFKQFERDNNGRVYVECFTAVSQNRFMHEDICTLALDKITSLIILPFHCTWTNDGLIDEDDNAVRTMNCSVLERAPCSVGIFADRGHLGLAAVVASSTKIYKYSVCVIYLGGNDDREAVAYAKRMAMDGRVKLTVLKLRAQEEEEELTKWEKMLESEVMKDLKVNSSEEGRVRYIEEVSEDGPQTALRLREMVNEYDLMIVGRRHGLKSAQTVGLSEWSEFSELGILGDLIVSTDINNRTSVLVIQQQIIRQ